MEDEKLVLLTDNLGRLILGMYLGDSSPGFMKIQDPYLLKMTQKENNTLDTAPIPYIFHEFLEQDHRTGVVYEFSQHLFTVSKNAVLTEGIKNLYNNAVSFAKPKPEEVKNAKKVELFDNE